MLIGEDEYQTNVTLPKFAHSHLYRDFHVAYVFADSDDPNRFPGIEAVRDADLLLVSVRRRSLPVPQLQIVRDYVELGRPVVGIRTASHAFALRDGQQVPVGHAIWPEFDADVLGGHYTGHHGNKGQADEKTYVRLAQDTSGDPIVGGGSTEPPVYAKGEYETTSWLYRTSPLRPGTRVVMMGRVGDRQPHEPVTWTFIHAGGGRTFYTSLGHPDDFKQSDFQRLLRNGIYWALDMPLPAALSPKSETANR
jgi:type 1 glutamine amidotransferase